MKKYFILFSILVLMSFLTFMIIKIVKAKKTATLGNIKKQNLPNFTFYNLNGIKTDNSFLKKGTPIILIYFNTDCEHCQYEAGQLKANIGLLKNAQIVMVSFNSITEIRQFSYLYKLDKSTQVTFLMDKEYKFTKWFGSCSIPSVFIYSSKHELLKEYYGEVKIQAIAKLL